MAEGYKPESSEEKSSFERYKEYINKKKDEICHHATMAVMQTPTSCAFIATGAKALMEGNTVEATAWLTAGGLAGFSAAVNFYGIRRSAEKMRKAKLEEIDENESDDE